MLTIHWLARRCAGKSENEEIEMVEIPVKCLKPEKFVTKRWDVGVVDLKERGLTPLGRVQSFRLELDKWEVSVTETESVPPEIQSLPSLTSDLDDTFSIASSDVSLSVPE